MDNFEKVNPAHPDKIMDRIAGAIVDLAYSKDPRPRVAVEGCIGHGLCTILIETSVDIESNEVRDIVDRICQDDISTYMIRVVGQDEKLAENQREKIRCGDNGYFVGLPITETQQKLTDIVSDIYDSTPTDGKALITPDTIVICQSNIDSKEFSVGNRRLIVNPLGRWTGGTEVDSGAINRKLGSDLGDAVRGAGLHGKDLSKADVTGQIVAHLFAQRFNVEVTVTCGIGDEELVICWDEEDGECKEYRLPFDEAVRLAWVYVSEIGGFEKLAEWGIIRPNRKV